MIVTETEAKTKICHETIINRSLRGHCLGSNCMAWRWLRDEDDRPHPKLGYCGKAGRP